MPRLLTRLNVKEDCASLKTDKHFDILFESRNDLSIRTDLKAALSELDHIVYFCDLFLGLDLAVEIQCCHLHHLGQYFCDYAIVLGEAGTLVRALIGV